MIKAQVTVMKFHHDNLISICKTYAFDVRSFSVYHVQHEQEEITAKNH